MPGVGWRGCEQRQCGRVKRYVRMHRRKMFRAGDVAERCGKTVNREMKRQSTRDEHGEVQGSEHDGVPMQRSESGRPSAYRSRPTLRRVDGLSDPVETVAVQADTKDNETARLIEDAKSSWQFLLVDGIARVIAIFDACRGLVLAYRCDVIRPCRRRPAWRWWDDT